MKNKIALGLLFVVVAAVAFVNIISEDVPSAIADPNPPTPVIHELAAIAEDTSTSNGILDLPIGTLLGGNPPNNIILRETRVFETTTGPETINIGTLINCDHEPNEPDPCGG